jgi:hypothetical protein
LPRFDFDFPGGTPQELVDALNKPLRGSLNVVIPPGADAAQIPALKLRSVNVAQVFDALQRSSQRTVVSRFGKGFQSSVDQYSFTTTGVPTETSVWSFQYFPGQRLRAEGLSYRFYQLGPYLDSLKIEDITTAIETALHMLRIEAGPNLKFHPETKLLIAVGDEGQFEIIDDVLKELAKGSAKPARLSEVLVNGEVNKPGNLPLPKDQKLTIIDAIGRAGGLTSKAQPANIKFSRPGQNQRVLGFDELKKENDPTKMIYLEPGDVIDVGPR